eukprot:271754-Chlamydomonas_euryale.AAC.1
MALPTTPPSWLSPPHYPQDHTSHGRPPTMLGVRAHLVALLKTQALLLGVAVHEAHEAVPLESRLHHVACLDRLRLAIDELGLHVRRRKRAFVVLHEQARNVAQVSGCLKDGRALKDKQRGAGGAGAAAAKAHFRDGRLINAANELEARRLRAH